MSLARKEDATITDGADDDNNDDDIRGKTGRSATEEL